jgi:hypothetical protein
MLRCCSHRRSAAVGSKTFRLVVLGPAICQSKQLLKAFCIKSEAAAGLRQPSTPCLATCDTGRPWPPRRTPVPLGQAVVSHRCEDDPAWPGRQCSKLNICNHTKRIWVLLPHLKWSKTMERSKTENRSAFAQAIKRRDGVMREMLGMGSDPVGHAEGDKHHRQRVAGRRDRTSAGWVDTAATGVQHREGRPLRRNLTAVSGVWMFLLSSLARSNMLLSLRRRTRTK